LAAGISYHFTHGLICDIPKRGFDRKENTGFLKNEPSNILTKFPRVLMYLIILCGFLVFFVGFFNIYSQKHLKKPESENGLKLMREWLITL